DGGSGCWQPTPRHELARCGKRLAPGRARPAFCFAHLSMPAKPPMAKIGRNEPCHCGSGLKYKKCHGGPAGGPAAKALVSIPNVLEMHRADERIREQQQGLGRPIVGFK